MTRIHSFSRYNMLLKILVSFQIMCSTLYASLSSFDNVTTTAVFDLTVTPQGLTIPSQSSRPYSVRTNSPISRIHSFFTPDTPVYLSDTNRNIVTVPLTEAVETVFCLDFPSELSITPGSLFAEHFGSAMLLPPSENRPSFQLIAGNVIDPTTECYEGTIGYATTGDRAIGFDATVSLIAAEGQTFTNRTVTQLSGARTQFGIDTQSEKTAIPIDIYRLWETELLTVAGVANREDLNRMDWNTFIHRLPTIQFMVYVSRDSNDVAATILMEPADYIEVLSPVGANVKLSPSLFFDRPGMGLNALRHVGVFLDYVNREIGLCEPL